MASQLGWTQNLFRGVSLNGLPHLSSVGWPWLVRWPGNKCLSFCIKPSFRAPSYVTVKMDLGGSLVYTASTHSSKWHFSKRLAAPAPYPWEWGQARPGQDIWRWVVGRIMPRVANQVGLQCHSLRESSSRRQDQPLHSHSHFGQKETKIVMTITLKETEKQVNLK